MARQKDLHKQYGTACKIGITLISKVIETNEWQMSPFKSQADY